MYRPPRRARIARGCLGPVVPAGSMSYRSMCGSAPDVSNGMSRPGHVTYSTVACHRSPTRRDTVRGMEVTIRRARTGDVRGIRRLIDLYATKRRLLSKATVALYEDVQDFWVAADGETVVGCGALHVMWEDLAEVRTVAVDPAYRGRKIGARIVEALLSAARDLGVAKVFCLTFETEFFASFG